MLYSSSKTQDCTVPGRSNHLSLSIQMTVHTRGNRNCSMPAPHRHPNMIDVEIFQLTEPVYLPVYVYSSRKGDAVSYSVIQLSIPISTHLLRVLEQPRSRKYVFDIVVPIDSRLTKS